MIVEIYGGSSVNKGAYLMVLAVQQALRERFGEVTFAMDPGERMPFEERALRGLRYTYSLEPLYPRGRLLLRKATLATDRFVSPRQKDLCGLVARADCDALLDVSGYRYGDFWGAGTVWIFAELAAHYHKQGKPVILLPQMFGPFNQPKVKAAFARVLKHTTLAYAREETSRKVVADHFNVGARLKLAPDFTIGLGKPQAVTEKVAYLVPNSKVFSKPEIGGERYLACLQRACELFQSHGLKCRLLLFDTAPEDRKLLAVLVDKLRLSDPDAIVTETDPLRLKAMLGAATLIFSSRFHACVCGLSSHVPVLTYGWAHKYQALHEDFDVPELIVDAADPCADITSKVDRLMQDRETVRQHLAQAAEKLTAKNRTMWEEIFAVIESRRAPDSAA